MPKPPANGAASRPAHNSAEPHQTAACSCARHDAPDSPSESASLVGQDRLTEATPRSEAADLLAETLIPTFDHPPTPLDIDAPPEWYEILGYKLPHPCGVWRWHNLETEQNVPFRCGRWRCPICGYRKAKEWCEILEFAPVQRHVVITRLDHDRAAASQRLKNIIKGVRRGEAVEPDRRGRRRRRSFEYLATAERHSKAGIHVHMLQHGDFVHQGLFADMLARYGAGRVNWIESIAEPDRQTALTRYITRHLVSVEHPFQPKVGARIRYSRRFFDPTGELSAVAIREALTPRNPDSMWTLVMNGEPLPSRDRSVS